MELIENQKRRNRIAKQAQLEEEWHVERRRAISEADKATKRGCAEGAETVVRTTWG